MHLLIKLRNVSHSSERKIKFALTISLSDVSNARIFVLIVGKVIVTVNTVHE